MRLLVSLTPKARVDPRRKVGRMALIEILRSFERGMDELTASQLVEYSGVPRSSAFRALGVLLKEGYVYQDPSSRRYTLGPRILQLGSIARRQLSSEHIVGAPLMDLAKRTGETVTFSYLEGPVRVCAYVIEAPSELRLLAQVGSRYQLHLGAAGRAILAYLPEEIAASTLKAYGLPRAEIAAIVAQLKKIRAQGYAVTTGERVPGASSIAAPVFVRDDIHGSIAIAGPTARVQPMVERHTPLVVEAAHLMSRRLSATPGQRARLRDRRKRATR
ncbi:MAG: IclR family transcriptional regulator [Chloroflexota bacterium]|nr:IclR family transcriptional regulator [Chloroflexota bacterium]